MSTRGLYGFVIDGTVKVTYNHSDSYPDWLGRNVLEFVRQLVKDGAVDSAAQRVHDLRVVTDETPVTDEDIETLRPWTNISVGSRRERPDWYQLLRDTQGNPDAILSSGYISDGADFALDSLFCEWGYVVDFDAGVLEVYRGFQKAQPTAGRWVGTEQTGSSGYWAINRVEAFPFAELPEVDDFIGRLNAEE